MKKILLVLGVIMLLGVGGSYGIERMLAQPSHGSAAVPADVAPKKKLAVPSQATTAPDAQQNSYYTLQLPVGYQAQGTGQAAGSQLYQQSFIKNSQDGRYAISVAIAMMPEGGISEDTSYRLRKQQASKYQFSNYQAGQATLELATDTESGNVVAFWPHDNHLATISIASGVPDPSPDGLAASKKILQTIIAGWQWN